MSRGIVKVTPKGGSGSLQVTVADPNPYGVSPEDMLSFEDPGFPTPEGNTALIEITSQTTCSIVRMATPEEEEEWH